MIAMRYNRTSTKVLTRCANSREHGLAYMGGVGMAKYTPQDGPSLFDGKVCARCGFWTLRQNMIAEKRKPDGLSSICKKCKAASGTPEMYRRNYERYRDAVLARAKRRYTAKRSDILKYAADYRAKNGDRIRANLRAYQKVNPAPWKASAHRRMARQHNAEGSYTAAEWQALLAHFGACCLACGATKHLSADHVVPLARSGTGWISNIQPLCRRCNSKKATKSTDYRDPANLAAFLASLETHDGS